MDEEIWKDVPGYEGKYQVSNMGWVRSLPRRAAAPRGGYYQKTQVVLAPFCKQGYLFVSLVDGHGKIKQFAVHRLVMRVFVGPAPDGEQINHIDGDKHNARLENLEYVRPVDNIRHARAMHGNWSPRGEKNGQSKLTGVQVTEIRGLIGRGMTQTNIAAIYGVSRRCIRAIITGRTWKHHE